MTLLTDKLIHRIKEIERLIKKADKAPSFSNTYSLNSMREHIDEIESLFSRNNSHWAAETVDLLIHCFLFLERNGKKKETMEVLIEKRVEKFKKKISATL